MRIYSARILGNLSIILGSVSDALRRLRRLARWMQRAHRGVKKKFPNTKDMIEATFTILLQES